MNKFHLALFAFVLCAFFSGAALSQEKADEVPYRQDSGLITAEYYLASGKYTQALQVLGSVLQRNPQSADAYVYRGFAYQQLGDDKKALDNYTQALKIDPRHLGANFYLGVLYLNTGQKPLAFEQLQALRLICAGTECAEETELENLINQAKKN